jgi:squalene-hopene/tetraprenyl-beta-curcumene cyclase
MRRGLRYLRREQRPDGSWFGRWGVNYVYGTGGVLPAFRSARRDMSKGRFRRAAAWLRDRQNADGGWGETCASYDDPALAGRGQSTASQTAWGLIGLLAADAPNEGIAGGVRWLVERQEEDGQWQEPQFTGTGFPGDFYIKYHLYRNYWPLTALGRYREALTSER